MRTDDELVRDCIFRVATVDHHTIALLSDILEVNERLTYARRGYESLYEWMTKELKLCNATAFRKLRAVQAARSVPNLVEKIAKGDLTLSSVACLQTAINAEERVLKVKFTPAECAEFFRQIERLSARDAERFIAEHFVVGCAKPDSVRARAGHQTEICVTLSAEQMEKLKRVKDLRAHANCGAGYAEVIEDLCDFFLKAKDPLRKKSRETVTRPASDTEVSRSFAMLRGIVFRRDGMQCSYVDSSTKRRCEATRLLEIDHIQPRSQGGTDDLANLRVLCRTHNQLRNQIE